MLGFLVLPQNVAIEHLVPFHQLIIPFPTVRPFFLINLQITLDNGVPLLNGVQTSVSTN